MKVQIQP